MIPKETDNFLNRVRQALALPIRTRCAELTVLLDRGSTLELQTFFPLLIDSIFGPQGTISWGLRTPGNIDEDFRQLEHFLSPCGPMFKLIYTLLKDPSAKYDFQLMYLPTKLQQLLENAQLHPFYADLVHVNMQTRRPIALLLNPFDYYMFHFAYHLINPWHQRSAATGQPNWNTVYYVLCCDYMLHFLPTDPSTTVLPVIYYNGKSPVPQYHQQTHFSRSPIGSKLINANTLNQSIEDYGLHQNFGRHPRNEIWRSETLLTVFIDMWLNNDQINQINSSFNSSQMPRLLQYSELPTVEYMRIIRVLMKQLHAFSASAKIDDTHMCELKKITIPMLQGKFYVFLRNLIHRWPLDGSFRLVLELWLTYIQPWRYPPSVNQKNILNKQNLDLDDINSTASSPNVDREHLPFLAENLLVYVVIFQQLLPRFTRVDLVSPKMSVMLYRISKVFNQSNLVSLLQEIEQSVDNNHSPTHSFSTHWSTNLPPLNPTSNWCSNTTAMSNMTFTSLDSTANEPSSIIRKPHDATFMNSLFGDRKWSAVVRQKIFELEGPSFCYKPLFCEPPAVEIYDLILHLKKSIKVAQELVEIKQSEEQQLHSSFWGLFKSIWESPVTNDEFSLSERVKVPAYLENALQNLTTLFKISQLPENDFDTSASSTATNSFEMLNNFKFLSPEQVRERVKRIKFEGDPDLHPIRSTEITFLVRMLYQIALKLNSQYRDQFCQLYYDQSYWGRLSRQILSPPTTIYRFDKSRSDSPRVSQDLPPRISFRRFATYKFLGYLCVGALIALFFGYSPTSYLFYLLLLCGIYKCIKAFATTSVTHSYPTQGFGNISFDDSF